MKRKIISVGLFLLIVSFLLAQEELPQEVALPDDTEATLIKKIDPGVVVIKNEQGIGSGFVVSPDGYILTNGHVISSVIDDRDEEDPKAVVKKITVTLHNERRYQAKVIGHSLDPDVALLKIETPEPLTPLKLGDSNTVESGQKVYAYGAPGGMKRTLTSGIVSNTERTDLPTFTKVIQTDAAINPGNSGGPLLTETGEVIGINTYGGGRRGIGFTIPINVAKALKEHFLKYGYFKRADFPFFISGEIYDELSRVLGVGKGILVNYVVPGTAADKAGLENGDVIIEVNDQPAFAKNRAQLRDFFWGFSIMPVGSPVKFKVLRGTKGNYREHIITGTMAEDEPAVKYGYQFGEIKELRYDDLGLGVKRMTIAASLYYRIPDVNGVRVVRARGIAKKAGLRPKDLVTHIDNKAIKTQEDFQGQLENCLAQTQKYILVTLRRNNDTIKTAFKPNYELAGKKIILIQPAGQTQYLEITKRFLITNGCKIKILIVGKDKKIKADDFDAVMLMGDADAKILWNNKDVHRIIKRALKRKKVIGAIGAASVTLVNADASLLDKKITTDEAYAKYIIEKKAKYTGKDIQDDGLIVTTAGFKKKVVKEFLNKFRAVIKANE